MKTLTKKAIVLASAIAVAGAFAVCAASYSAVEPTAEGKSVTVDFSTTVAETDQITMLAYYVGEVDLGPNEYNIVFIEQLQKSEAGNSITFSLRDDDPTTGTYKVLMGGTGVDDAGFGTFTLESTPTGATISGTVDSLVYFGDPEGDEFLEQANMDYQTVATLWDADFTAEIDSVIVDSTVVMDEIYTNSFTFTGVADGTYILTLSRAGKCLKGILVTVNGEDINLGLKELKGVDMDDDTNITAGDISALVAVFKLPENTYGETNFDLKADENGDSTITSGDVSSAVSAFKTFNTYHELD